MALYPDPLQGGTIPLQGSVPQLQQPVTPQQTATPQNPAPAAAPLQQPAQVPIPQSALVPTSVPQPQSLPAPVPQPAPPVQTISQRITTPDVTQTPAPLPSDPSQQIAQTAGSAGLSIDDLTKIAQANSALSPDEIAQIRQSLGIDQLAQTAFTPPAQSTVDLFNQAYQSAGLGDLKAKIQGLSDQITQEQNNYAEAVAAVNENPFLTENSRVGRQQTIANEAQQKIGNLQQEQSNLNDLYTQGLTEANAFVTRNTNDFSTHQQLAAARLDYLNQQASQIAQAALAQKQQQTIYRYLPDYLQAKQQATEPFGSAQYGYFKYDPNTKSYVQVSGPAAQFESNPLTGDLFNKANGQTAGTTASGAPQAFGASAPAQITLAQKNNNPGNIRNPVTGQFNVYTTPQQGWQALVNDIQAKISGNNAHGLGPTSTLQDFFNVYAPTGDGNNNPSSYAQAVAQQLGVSPATKLGDLSGRAQDLATAIATHEGYFNGSTAPGTPSGNVIDQAAQRLVDGLDAPSQYPKTGTSGARNILIQDRANQLSLAQKGVPFDAQQAEVNYQNKQTVRPIINLEQSVESHLDTVLKDSEALNRSSSPAANKLNFEFQNEVGPGKELTQYLQAIQDAKGELSKLLAGSGTPTDETRSEADSMLNEFLGHDDLAAQIEQIRTLAKQKVEAYTNNNNGAQQQALPVSSSPVNISDINFAF